MVYILVLFDLLKRWIHDDFVCIFSIINFWCQHTGQYYYADIFYSIYSFMTNSKSFAFKIGIDHLWPQPLTNSYNWHPEFIRHFKYYVHLPNAISAYFDFKTSLSSMATLFNLVFLEPFDFRDLTYFILAPTLFCFCQFKGSHVDHLASSMIFWGWHFYQPCLRFT